MMKKKTYPDPQDLTEEEEQTAEDLKGLKEQNFYLNQLLSLKDQAFFRMQLLTKLEKLNDTIKESLDSLGEKIEGMGMEDEDE
jgi:hypothetical protein